MAKMEERLGWGEKKGTYRKIPKISPGAYIIFSKALLEGIIWASLIVGSKFTIFALFYFVFEGNFPSTSPQGGLNLEEQFNRGFFTLPVWGAYTWRGLFSEFYGILFFLFARALLSFLTASPFTPHSCPCFLSTHSTVS